MIAIHDGVLEFFFIVIICSNTITRHNACEAVEHTTHFIKKYDSSLEWQNPALIIPALNQKKKAIIFTINVVFP